MTLFTKITLIAVAVVSGLAAWAWIIGQAYIARGYFSVGGEWLMPILLLTIRAVFSELKKLYESVTTEREK